MDVDASNTLKSKNTEASFTFNTHVISLWYYINSINFANYSIAMKV
jgi:hypothetical protein